MHRASDDLSDPDRNLAESTGQADIPEDTMDLITEESNDSKITLPPRIASRFYRPTNNRRKSSAASSRRNSISSAHSHQSHSSTRHGGPQSSYIAQHLRRASIIEDRKTRLADRAAHAEKVRLRAALAKAAPRSTTNSEARALAAHHAREKNLAEIVANCAEEVKRAKGIAESMKEKREAEGKKLRREMEERLAEAERRREELLHKANTRRGRSLSQMRKSSSPTQEVKEKISESTAAKRIQQRWRVHRRWKALKEFADLGLTIDSVRETLFENVVELLAQERVVVGTAHVLRICGLKEGESGSVNEMTAVRTFLSAYLILGHPTQVLSSTGDSGEQEQVRVLPMKRDDLANPQLQDLVGKARDLLISFENVLSRLNAANNYTPPPAQLSPLSEVYATFYNAFIAWKARDSSTLIEMMVLQFVELDSIWQTVKDSTEAAVTESYKEGIRENQVKLMVRIKKLAGPVQGKRLIAKAIMEARKARAAKKPVGDSRPRAAESNSTTISDLAAAERSVTSHLQTLTPPPTPPRYSGSRADELRTASDTLRTTTAFVPDNRIIVHELAMNPDYRIECNYEDNRKKYYQIIFASMRNAVASGNSDDWVMAMAMNVKGKLQNLLTEGNSMHTAIGEALDEQVVAQELRSGQFSYEKFFAFMGSILPRLCAPFRDEELKTLVTQKLQTGDVVDRLEALLHFLDLMQVDFANYTLQKEKPALLEHGIEYEMQCFTRSMEKTSNDLTNTKIAWRESRTKVMAEAGRRDPENVGLARAIPSPEKIYVQMLVDIFTSLSAFSSKIPETLDLDKDRIMRIRADTLRIVTSGAVLLQAKNILKRDVRSQWKVEATRVYSVLENAKDTEQAAQGMQIALESSRSMPAATKKQLKDIVSKTVADAMRFSTWADPSEPHELRDPVLRLLLTRLRGHLLARLSASTEKEKVKSASTASENLAALGFPEFVQKVGAMVEEVARVGRLDRDAHGLWYESVASQVQDEMRGNAGPDDIYA
jgi:hypothetical protein